MQITAAIVRTPAGPFQFETFELDEPQADEVLVRIVATGICHSDLIARDQAQPPRTPIVLGHEGAGVVVRTGAAVTHVAPGDHVVLSFNSCGACFKCEHQHPAYCEDFRTLNGGGPRPDGSATLRDATGAAVNGAYFSQSSFATHALANARNTVKVDSAAPLELLGPLGCGIMTGAGAVLNVLKPEPGASFALFGCGGVGLAALMGAKIAGCDPIIAVDRDPGRLEIARRLGATHTFNANSDDVVAEINALGGVYYAVEATGVAPVIEQAIQVLKFGGACAVLGIPNPAAVLTLPALQSLIGKSILGITEGDSDPHQFIPYLVERHLAGELPLELLSRFYPFAEINEAAADSASGRTVKPIVRMPAAGEPGPQTGSRS